MAEATQYLPLTYIDFVPLPIGSSGAFSKGQKTERLDVLMNKANTWLSENPGCKVVTCESYELTVTFGDASSNDPIVTNRGKALAKYKRVLRLWVAAKTAADPREPTQIGYIYFIPNCLKSGGVFSKAQYERFGETLNRVNNELQLKPIPGRIINVETQDMKVHSSGVPDPDETAWTQGPSYLNVIRIFFMTGQPAYEQIGCADFVPKMTKQQGLTTFAEFEPFSSVVRQMNTYISNNPGLRVLNVQSVNYKMSGSMGGPGTIDTHRAAFSQIQGVNYLRILRLSFVTGPNQTGFPARTVTCKTFVPCQTAPWGMMSLPKFESQTATMQRALAWLNATGARVISAETTGVQILTGYDPENPYTIFAAKANQMLLMCFRVYLDGYYPEPDPSRLPPVPVVNDSGPCCAIL